jgi:hypothetical protein
MNQSDDYSRNILNKFKFAREEFLRAGIEIDESSQKEFI